MIVFFTNSYLLPFVIEALNNSNALSCLLVKILGFTEKITGLTGGVLGELFYFNQTGIGLRPQKGNPMESPPTGQIGTRRI